MNFFLRLPLETYKTVSPVLKTESPVLNTANTVSNTMETVKTVSFALETPKTVPVSQPIRPDPISNVIQAVGYYSDLKYPNCITTEVKLSPLQLSNGNQCDGAHWQSKSKNSEWNKDSKLFKQCKIL